MNKYKQNIRPYNNKNQAHGYWETYWSNDDIAYKGNWINDKKIGYWELNDKNKFYLI